MAQDPAVLLNPGFATDITVFILMPWLYSLTGYTIRPWSYQSITVLNNCVVCGSTFYHVQNVIGIPEKTP